MTCPTSKRLSKPALAAIIAAVTYTVILSWLCTLKYLSFGYDDFDLAIDAQSTWNICHGSLESSIHRIPFLGNHMRLILFPLAPLYAIFKTPLFFLYLQSMALGLAAWGIFLVARKQISEGWALHFVIAFLVYPPLIHMNLYEFHPIAFVVPLFIFMLHFYLNERFGLYCVFLVVALLCQENVSLIAVMMGILALMNRRAKRWVVTPLLLGLFYFSIAVLVIMPRLSGGTIQLYNIYGEMGGSMPEIMENMIMHPIKALGIMLEPDKLNFLILLFAPICFLSCLAPGLLLPLLPILAQRLLSIRPSESTIMHHYQAEFIPFLFVAAIIGARRILKYRPEFTARLLAIILVAFPLTAFLTCHVLSATVEIVRTGFRHDPLIARKTYVVRNIEDDAAVLASFEFQPQLANRQHLYSLHHLYTGHYTLSTVPYPTPVKLDYLVLDTMDRLTFSHEGYYHPDNYRNLQKLLSSNEWLLIENTESLVVFRKQTRGSEPINRPLIQYVKRAPAAPAGWQPVKSGKCTLLSYELLAGESNNTKQLVLYWQTPALPVSDFNIHINMLQSNGAATYESIIAPGSRIHPPQSWKPHSIVKDNHTIFTSAPTDAVRLVVSAIPAYVVKP